MGLELAGAEQRGSYGDSDEVNFTDSQLVYQVRNALSSALEGDPVHYKELVALMHHRHRLNPEEVATLVTCLKALSAAAACIDIIHHRSLLDAIFSMSLWDYKSYAILDALVELVVSLAASSAKYVDLCLDMLVRDFAPPFRLLSFLEQPDGVTRKYQVLDRVHSTLKDIADLVPLSPLRLEKIVRDRMPTAQWKEPKLLVMYVENMLRLESGAIGELVGSSMIMAVVDRLIDLDVEISWDELLQDDFSKGMFDMELEKPEGPVEDFQHDGDELHGEIWGEKFFGGSEVAKTLDQLMDVTFEHLKFSYESGRLNLVFEVLLQSFQKTVLTAHKSKFAQFVMFYACSLDPENCGQQFAVTLLNIFLTSTYPQWRMSAVAYLASYLSRAKFVSTSLVVYMLERLVNWCSDYCKNQDGNCNPRAHKVFYAACQAFMYVLCFRMRSMISIPRHRSQLVLMRIDEILMHPLNPLKVCLPSIVEEFLRVAKTSRVFAVPENCVPDGLVESDLSKAFGGFERLDMFFPFDPYLLKKSDRFIMPNFVYWSMVTRPYDEQGDYKNEEEYSSDEDADEFSVGGIRMALNDAAARSYNEEDEEGYDLDDDFDHSLNQMSITPKTALSSYLFGGTLQTCAQMPSRIRPSTSPESL